MRYSAHPRGSSRTVIDIAVGILVGLRGCTPEDAFGELVATVGESGIGIGSLAAALVALASGTAGAAANDLAASAVWGGLISPRTQIAVAS
ncbi:MAG: hypothetical protein QOH57_2031 [Mycobacterium sp.]|jgi:hypothetical protein|nr:hypothetical protein [Mycobacterium sp.]